MSFNIEFAPWIDEVRSYLFDDSKKFHEIKKTLKAVDFSNLSYADRSRLYKMFDPKCEISDELFKRQLDLYFSLLESKSSPMKIPIFSDYIEYVYSQDINRFTDGQFDALSSRLVKTTAKDLSEPLKAFIDKLPTAFHKNIDMLTNRRIDSLVNILNGLKLSYEEMPKECQWFIRQIYKACAVKTEIAENNRDSLRYRFGEDRQVYYNLFNKAFARIEPYDIWIDEPAKKITYPRMIDYANFQHELIVDYKSPLTYENFAANARTLQLPRFPEYDRRNSSYYEYYLREPREYKDYAKKMRSHFVDMVRAELKYVDSNFDKFMSDFWEGKYRFAPTNKKITQVRKFMNGTHKNEILTNYADYLIDAVHLDELTKLSHRDIYTVPEKPRQEVVKKAESTIASNNRVETEKVVPVEVGQKDSNFSSSSTSVKTVKETKEESRLNEKLQDVQFKKFDPSKEKILTGTQLNLFSEIEERQ